VSALLAGAAAGATHVLGGPDHFAAVAPDLSRAPIRAARLGATWGLGHGAGVLLAAAIGRGLGALVDLASLSAWAELSVGVALIAVGLRALPRRRERPPPVGRAAFGVGLLHGAAGAHHLFLVLPALTLGPTEAALYLGAYIGCACAVMAAAGALVARGLEGRGEKVRRAAVTAAAALAIGLGVFWIATAPPLG